MATYIYGSNVIANMTSNSSVFQIASASSEYGTSYAAWKAFDGVSSNAQGWLSRGIAFPIFLQIKLQNKVIARKYSLFSARQVESPKDWTFEGSNDGVEWIVLDTQVNVNSWLNGGIKEFTFNNNEAFQFYRINITSHNGDVNYVGVSEFSIYEATILYDNKILFSSGDKFYSVGGIKYENAIPKMTSNTSASPIVPIFSTEWTNGIQTGAGSAFNAFDGDKEKVFGWSSASSGYYIGIDWSIEKKIIGYRLTSHSSISNTPPTAWYFESSNDNSTWTILDTKTGVSWTKGETKGFIVNNELSYRYYRIRGTLNITWAIAEFELLHLSPSYLVSVPKLNEESFLRYGRDSSLPFNLINKVQKNKDEYNSLGSGKTFGHKIDISKRRVDKITLG